MRIRREIVIAAASVHLAVAALFSTHVRVELLLPGAIEQPLRVYGNYSGASTHFNFFAPAVPTQPRVTFVLAMRDGTSRTVDLATPSAEVNQRFANMFGSYELADLRPFLVRAWAVYELGLYPDAQAVDVRVEVLDLPTLAQAQAGRKPSWVEVERTVVRREELGAR
jgi:hypothetical protein